MHQVYAHQFGSFLNVTELKAPPRRIFPSVWSRSERALFTAIKSRYMHDAPPVTFVEALQSLDRDAVVGHVQDFVDSDIPMTARLRRRANGWLDKHR